MEETNKTSIAWAVSGFISGLVSIPLLFAPYFGLPLAIFALVAHSKQKKIKEHGLSMAGFILGIIGIILNAITLIFLVLGLLFLGAMGGY